MTETAAKHLNGSHSKQHSECSLEYSRESLNRFGFYRIDRLTQDEVIASFSDGIIRGIWKSNSDKQSDDIDSPPEEALPAPLKQIIEKWFSLGWKDDESFAYEDSALPVEVEEQSDNLASDTETNDFLQWTPDNLCSAILEEDSESDMPRLRKMIFIAEDTGFTVDQSKLLAPWLLNFAQRHRDSNDPQDEAAVWSAIRTGASMLSPNSADRLLPLLEPGHSIETSLVTVKMIGRIFEAQPPSNIDKHTNLADKVCQIAEFLLNRYSITVSQSAAMAQLAVYALAAMASNETHRIVKAVHELEVVWFTRRTLRKLCELRDIWASHTAAVANEPNNLLNKVIQTLDRD